MSTVRTRTFLAKQLEDALPKRKYVIFPNSDKRDEYGKPTLILNRSGIQPLPEAPLVIRANEYQLLVVSDMVIGADDYLDDLVDEVIDALGEIPLAHFQSAERRIHDEHPAYEITLAIPDDRQNREN
jgi:hypothetical protein